MEAAAPAADTVTAQQTCFVVMGFGKKTDFETGRVLDLDKSYRTLIKPAVEAAGLKCIRADEIVHSGLIDVPMYQQLLEADVVVADLSTSNKNAFYELGIRHALRPFTTIIIAEDGIKTFSFDVNHVAVRQYHHMGDAIDYDEVLRFRELLTGAIKTIIAQNPMAQDSPVYTFLQGLNAPSLAAKMQAAVQDSLADAAATEAAAPVPAAGSAPEATPRGLLMQQVAQAIQEENWQTAKSLLETVRQLEKQARALSRAEAQKRGATPSAFEDVEDPYILQQLALATYKSKEPDERQSLLQAHDLLHVFSPATSNDTETLGLWGVIHKRLWFVGQKDAATNPTDLAEYIDQAVRAYGRGFYLRNDYYNGINYAFLLNARAAAATDPAEAIADYVRARHVRREVQQLCDQWLAAHPLEGFSNKSSEAAVECARNHYWILATKAEAALGLGDEAQAQQLLEEARSIGRDQQLAHLAPEAWMVDTTQEQFDRLRDYLAHSPLDALKR